MHLHAPARALSFSFALRARFLFLALSLSLLACRDAAQADSYSSIGSTVPGRTCTACGESSHHLHFLGDAHDVEAISQSRLECVPKIGAYIAIFHGVWRFDVCGY